MSLVEFFDLIGSHVVEILSDTIGWLSDEVIPEGVLMNKVNKG